MDGPFETHVETVICREGRRGGVCVCNELLLSLLERSDRHAERMALRGMRLAVRVDDFFQTYEANDPGGHMDAVMEGVAG